jgi:hypothetical protein
MQTGLFKSFKQVKTCFLTDCEPLKLKFLLNFLFMWNNPTYHTEEIAINVVNNIIAIVHIGHIRARVQARARRRRIVRVAGYIRDRVGDKT